MDKQQAAHELKRALRDIASAKTALSSALGKDGNLPFAYAQLAEAEKKVKRALRELE
ncbi:protein of unknown function (plasmid) [Cupriavidus taiwanensis]|uniref:Uncharacterized protein n=1 Tax=Cupriavidus taiwanensis TaxID=164546 RepID=A0A375IRG6_9BURK|nr:hypothetical protein [Cupriavidus taiwanensis]SPK77214.1 protein of unknown function [Cupriavidus taiwanensis]